MKKLLPYLPGLAIILILMVIGMNTANDYGISWDEPDQRLIGQLAYDYVFHGSKELLSYMFRQYGTGYELPLVWLEKVMGLKDTREIYFMRHQVTHMLFLLSGFALYVMSFRLSRNQVLASIATLVFLLSPRTFAHSFFNTKDIPFLCFVVFTLLASNLAFSKDKLPYYITLGAVAGYTTSIRVMGIMFFVFLLLMLVADMMGTGADKTARRKRLYNLLSFSGAFFLVLYISWPYLWTNPIGNFMESYELMSHYKWPGKVLMGGSFEDATNLPSNYFPTWFSISVPVLWLLAGLAGAVFIIIDTVRKPKLFIANTTERNYLLFLLCFTAPVFAVIQLHSVVYDDWRHLYFVYPSFALMALYLMVRFNNAKTKFVIIGLAAVQVAMVSVFMVSNHPFEQVYFNELVSHETGSLRDNYELEYWGCSYRNALEYIAKNDTSSKIKVAGDPMPPIERNLLILDPKDRARFQITDPKEARYFITNFRGYLGEYPSWAPPLKDVMFNINVLNSPVIRIYDLKKVNNLK